MIETALKGKRVVLEPLEDLGYLIDLVYFDNKEKYTREVIAQIFRDYEYKFWLIKKDDRRLGATGYFIVNGKYLLEAMKDHSNRDIGITYSIEVGNLMLGYIFTLTDRVCTFARKEDRGVQILCRKLGFKEIKKDNSFIFYEKEK